MDERDRLKLYDRLGEVLGLDDAGRLMELLPPHGWDELATKDQLASTAALLRGEIAELRGEMATGFAELRSEMAAMQRTLLIAMASLMLSVWIALLLA